ncbi:MAG: shikimate kinase [Candidatus Cloacimonadales bacterium]
MSKSKVFIVGFMGSGKSHIGRKLAETLGENHIDLDYLLEKQCMLSIRDIFKTYGEKKFRTLERNILLSTPSSGIVSTGGGVILDSKNREYLKKFTVVYLNPPWEIIYQRIKTSTRPLVLKYSYDELYAIYLDRKQLYTEVANISIDDIEEEEIISNIIKYINS